MEESNQPKIKMAKYVSLTLYNNSEEGKSRSLVWSSRNGNPRINVYTDNEIKKPDGSVDYDKFIIAPFTILKLKTAITLFRELLASGVNDYIEIDCLYPVYENNVKTEKKSVRAKVRFGIDTNGLCYFYIEDGMKPKIKFNITEDGWHLYRKGKADVDGIDKAKLSQLHAASYLDLLEKFFIKEAVETLTNVSYQEDRKAGGGGYKNNYPKKQYSKPYTKPYVKAEESTSTSTGSTTDDLF